MIYTTNAFTISGIAVIGFTTDSGASVGLAELLTRPRAFAALCSVLGEEPELNVKNLGSDQDPLWFAELVLSHPVVGATNVANLFDPALPEDQKFFQEQVTLCCNLLAHDDLVLHTKFNKIGIISRELLIKAQEASQPLRDCKQMKVGDPVEFAVPSYEELCQVYSSKSALAQVEDDSDDTDVGESILTPDQISRMLNRQGDADATQHFGVAIPAPTAAASVDVEALSSYASLDPKINKDYIPVDTVFKYYDSVAYRDCIQLMKAPIDPKLIEGSPNNNTSEIFANEKRYFDALCRLVDEGIMNETGVQTQQELNVLIHQGRHSIIVDQYLEDLCQDAMELNWAHTGTVMSRAVSGTAVDDDSNEVDETVVGIPGYYTIQRGEGDSFKKVSLAHLAKERIYSGELHIGMEEVKAYCNRTVLNSYSWVYALIQLLRWGARKPSCLCIDSQDNSKPMYLNLITMIPTTFKGNLKDLTPKLNELGTPYRLISQIKIPPHAEVFESVHSYTGISLDPNTSYTAGVVLETTYVEDSQLSKWTIVDLFTFVEHIKSGYLKVPGVEFDSATNKIHVTVPNLQDADLMQLTSMGSSTQLDIMKSPKLVRYAGILGKRIPNLGVAEFNWVRIFKQFESLTSWDPVLKCAQVVNNPDGQKRNADWLELRKHTGMTSEILALTYLCVPMVQPFFSVWGEASQNADLGELLTLAFENATAVPQSPVSKLQTTTNIDTRFTSQLRKCKRFLEYQRDGKPLFYAGYFTGVLDSGEKTNCFCLWTAEEFQKPEVTPTAINWQVFIKNIYTGYANAVQQAKATGNQQPINQFFGARCVCATKDTWAKVIAYVKEDQLKAKG